MTLLRTGLLVLASMAMGFTALAGTVFAVWILRPEPGWLYLLIGSIGGLRLTFLVAQFLYMKLEEASQ